MTVRAELQIVETDVGLPRRAPRGSVFGAAAGAVAVVVTVFHGFSAAMSARDDVLGSGVPGFVLAVVLVLVTSFVLAATADVASDHGARLMLAAALLAILGWVTVFAIGAPLLLAASLAAAGALRASLVSSHQRTLAWSLLAVVAGLTAFVAADLVATLS